MVAFDDRPIDCDLTGLFSKIDILSGTTVQQIGVNLALANKREGALPMRGIGAGSKFRTAVRAVTNQDMDLQVHANRGCAGRSSTSGHAIVLHLDALPEHSHNLRTFNVR